MAAPAYMWGRPAARGQPKDSCHVKRPETLEKQALRLPAIDPRVRIGHVHLKVADLQRALDFYCGVLGFELTTSRPGAAFISAGGYHHHIGLNTWESLGGSPPAPGHHRPLPHRHPLPDPQAAGRRAAPADRRQDPAGGRQRPRRLRGALPARPGRQRRRALLGPAEGDVAAEAGRLACRCSPIRSTCTICWRSWTGLHRQPAARVAGNANEAMTNQLFCCCRKCRFSPR